MGVLEQVTKMKNEGKTNVEIRDALTKQKVSPKEIQNALSHLDIKNAVSNTAENPGGMQDPPSPTQEEQGDQEAGQDTYTPQPPQLNQGGQYNQQGYAQDAGYGQGYDQGNYQQGYGDQYAPAPQQGDYYQQYQGQEGYSPDAGYSQGGYSGSDTMVEISEQVFEEKSRDMSKKLESIEEFKNLSQAKLDRLDERMKRMESIIDRLQSAILERIGSYGRDIGSIKNEMSMMQDTFTKTMSKREGTKKSETSKDKKTSKK